MVNINRFVKQIAKANLKVKLKWVAQMGGG